MNFLKIYDKNEIIQGFQILWNNRYIYDNFTLGKNKFKCDIIVKCRIHGDFTTKLQRHLKSGCKHCSEITRTRKLRKAKKYTKDFFAEKANKIHNEKYTYNLHNFKSTISKVEILCPIHGISIQEARRHLSGDGCPLCGNITRNRKNEKKYNTFVEECNKIHNNKYDYIDYKGYNTPISILCPVHGVFVQKPREHIRGSGCQKCSSRISIKSQRWLDYLKVYNREVYLKDVKMIPDGYNSETKTVYLFHGDYWHGNPKIYDPSNTNPSCKKTYGELYNKTIKSEKKYKDNGYEVVSIWENDWDNK